MVGVLVTVMVPAVVLAQETKAKTTGLTRCEQFDSALEVRATSIDELARSKSDTAGRIDARLTGLVGRLEVRKLDTTRLVADQTELARRSALVARDYGDLAVSVRAAKGSCAAASSLQPARDKLVILQTDIHDFQTWLQVILRADILRLKGGA
jgi:hypothetical protein